MTKYSTKLVEEVETLRKTMDLNKSQMAHYLDVSLPHYSEYISGNRRMPLRLLRRLYKEGISADLLLSPQKGAKNE